MTACAEAGEHTGDEHRQATSMLMLLCDEFACVMVFEKLFFEKLIRRNSAA